MDSIPQDSLTPLKVCIRCRETKPATGFHADKNKPDGLYPYCKQCRSRRKDPQAYQKRVADRSDGIKQCTKCGETKPLSEFHRQKDQPDGHKCYCKLCCKGVNAVDYAANHPARQAQRRGYYRLNTDAFKAQAMARYHADPAAWKARVKAWQVRNPEKKAAYGAKWTRENLKAVRENNRRRYARRKGAYTLFFTKEDLDRKRAYWGDRCWVCGKEPDSWDHVKPLVKGGAHILANLRPICRHCNSSKRDTWPYP